MDKLNLLFLAPYAGLRETIISVTEKMPDVAAQIYVGDLGDALTVASTIHTADYDVLISRGGTAELLRKNVEMPVVEIEISVNDMLRVISIAQQMNRRFAIVGYANITNASHAICDILQYDIPIVEIASASNAEPVISKLAGSGIELFIGDAVTVDTATKLGKSSLLITSGPESVLNAVREAQYLRECSRLIMRSNSVFRSVLGDVTDSIAIYNDAGSIIFINHPPLRLPISAFTNAVERCLPDLRGSQSINLTKHIDGVRLNIHGYVFRDGSSSHYIFRATAAYMPQELLAKAIIQYNYDEMNSAAAYSYTLPDKMLQYLSDKLGKNGTAPPIFIYGESGTNKPRLAQYIHMHYFSPTSPFTFIDCSLLSEKEWTAAVEDMNSPLYSKSGTIFFENIQMLSRSMQRQLNQFAADTTLTGRMHIICSSLTNLSDLMEKGEFSKELFMRISGLPVRVPPLRERKDDIPTLCGIFISRFCLDLSKQIIGFMPDAMEQMLNFSWPQNISQLESVVKQLVSVCSGSYISLRDTQNLLDSIRPASSVSDERLDLTKSLDEIEYDIIKHVLVEVNMNQTVAAERLGVSRSTLWRKLQAHKS